LKKNIDYDEELTKSFRFQNRELLDNYVILAVTNTDGIIKHISTNMCNVFKYKKSEILNKDYRFLIKKEFTNIFANQLNDSKLSRSTWNGEIKHSSKNDETIWTDTIITPLFNDEDELLGFIITSNNITKEKRLQKINEENILSKKYDSTVLDFMPSLSSAVLLKTSSGLHKVLWIIVFTIIFLLVWSSFSKIDDIVKTQGKIITSTDVQTISSLNGGIVKNIYVKEGDNVIKGQKIVELSDIEFKNKFNTNILNRLSLLAKIKRLQAQANDETIKEDYEVTSINPEIMYNEIELYNTNQEKLTATIGILKEQVKQHKNNINDSYKSLKIAKRNNNLLVQEMSIKKPLVEEHIISKIELLQLKRKINDAKTEIKRNKTSIQSFNSLLKETKRSIEETQQNYKLSAKDELISVFNELQKVEQDILYLKEKITNTIIVSPSDGVINTLNIKTKGSAISPGGIITEIIPNSKYLLAQIKINPSDIGFLYIGQKVRLKLKAYDFSLYGAIDCKISYISADTQIDNKDQKKEVYIVNVISTQQYVGQNKHLLVKPGMTVDADIITGKKSILDYIFKPIVKSLEK